MQLSQMDNTPEQIEPSVHLYQAVIGAFRAQGKTFAKWCDANGINRENGRAALHGIWRGPKARLAVEAIIEGADRESVLFLLKRRHSK